MQSNRTIIEPASSFSLRLKELWQYRELFYFFTWRDIRVKYKQTFLGVFWTIIQPLALMMLFAWVFAERLQVNTGNIRYETFLLSGLILWNLFYNAVSHAAESILQQSHVIRKIYFPRLIIPGASILTALFDFLISFAVFLLFCIFLQQELSWSALAFFPLAILMLIAASFGAGTLLSALNIRYRDFRYALPFLLQFLFFASQVVYELKSVEPAWLRNLLAANPVNGAIELFRGCMGNETDPTVLVISISSSVVLSITGLIYFRKTESHFADLA